jgi:HlyD family secretion protein
MMKLRRPRYLGWIITIVVVIAAIIVALLPRPIRVEQVVVRRQDLETTVEADGIVRARERFVVAMPATGVLERLSVEPGDSVIVGQIIGTIIPPELDERQRSEARARFSSINAGSAEVRQRLAALSPLIEQARRRTERLRRLEQAGAIPREQAENARDAYEQLQREADALRERERAIGFDSKAVLAILAGRPGQRVSVRAPASGVVLRCHEQSERTVLSGTPIVELGDTSQAEVVIDVLSIDAVKIRPGMSVNLDGWGGDSIVRATVRRVEPSARTRVSSLGIEEQRVNVIADIAARPPGLGDGYRVEAAIITERSEHALCIPLGTLLRDADQWYVLVVEDGIIRRRPVKLGARSALMTVVTSGLSDGEHIVQHPSENLREGDSVN